MNLKEEMVNILNFLYLPVNKYDFGKAVNLGVMGSSQIKNMENMTDWALRKKTKDFNPLSRFAHWGRPLHQRFNWLACDFLKEFDYEAQSCDEKKYLSNVRNKFIDMIYALEMKYKLRPLFVNKFLHKLRQLFIA
jgi:hypothetical protein